jgi:hypothetical protein
MKDEELISDPNNEKVSVLVAILRAEGLDSKDKISGVIGELKIFSPLTPLD